MRSGTVYRYFPEEYERLKSFSYAGTNTIKNIADIASVGGMTVVESGAGTGNISFQLTDAAGYPYGFDKSKAMLRSDFLSAARQYYAEWLEIRPEQLATPGMVAVPSAKRDVQQPGYGRIFPLYCFVSNS